MSDTQDPVRNIPLRPLWGAVGSRAAAIVGALVALTALLFDAPVEIACLRGALGWAAVLLAGRAVRWLLERVEVQEKKEPPAEAAEDPTS